MRILSVAFFTLASLAQAHAHEKIKKPPESACSYEISVGDICTPCPLVRRFAGACRRLLTRNTRCSSVTGRRSRSSAG